MSEEGLPPDSPNSSFGSFKDRMRANVRKWTDASLKSAWGQKLQHRIQTFEPAAAAEWANKTFQKQGASFYGKLATLVLCTYFLADLTALMVGKFIPEPPLYHAPRTAAQQRRQKTIDDYNIIFTRNLFNSRGIIPGEETGAPQDLGGAPTRTTLPLNLIGTLILRDELKSIATIEDKSAAMVYPVRETDEIPSKAKILKIESNRVIFINTSNGRREFVDLPEEASANNVRIQPGPSHAGGPGIEQTSPTSFNIAKKEVDNAFANLNEILTQARAIPNFENGAPAGYKLFQIVPGSIYAKLGLHDGDVVTGINGESINDPSVAVAKLGDLKTQNHVELQIKRDGRPSTFSYDFH